MKRERRLPSARRRERGLGALSVVLILFFVISLAAAYASRNMVFEQRSSANQYRATQAFEAADAGAEWALAMLNAGRIDDRCQPSATGATFRERYLRIDPASGAISAKTTAAGAALNPECVRTADGWSCSCPTDGAPSLTPPATAAPAPAFRLSFNPSGAAGRPGAFFIRTQACTRLDEACLTAQSAGNDAAARVTMAVALAGGIVAPPGAALTAGGAVDFGGAAARLSNTEPRANGLTIDALGNVNLAGLDLTSTPGAPGAVSVVANDSGLPAAPELLFTRVFGLNRSTYQQQPAAIVLACPAQCGAANLAALAARNPGRVFWLEGDVTLDQAIDIGTAASPVVLVIHGDFGATAAARVFGLVYLFHGAGPWASSGSPAIQGALVAEGGVTGTGAPTIAYDLGLLTQLRLASGSFVRVPGSWRDF